MITGSPSSHKILLRKLYQKRINTLSPERREGASRQAIEFLHPYVTGRAPQGIIGAFAPFRGEIDLWPLLQEWMKEGKLALPRIRRENLEFCLIGAIEELSPTLYGFLEPLAHLPKIDLEELALVLVPGLAFDNTLNRLGRGLGYYDRFLPQLPPATPKVGIGFLEQLSPTPLPIEEHDVLLTDRLLF